MNMKNLNPDLYEKICRVLDRTVLMSEEGNVESFFDFSDSGIRDFRLLGERSSILVVSYIRFRLQGNAALNSVVSYYSTVVQNGVYVAKWYE
jgi:hypothetical protein